MKVFNCHTHTKHSPDSSAEPEEMTLAALRCGLMGYAVTDHIDSETANVALFGEDPTGSYKDAKAQSKKHPEIKILAGVEIGEAVLSPEHEKYILGLNDWDIVLGSVHSVRMKGCSGFFSDIDFTPFDDRRIHEYLTQYFVDVEETAATTDYDSLSHLTVPLRYIVHKYGKNVKTERYYDSIDRTLKSVISRGRSLELNTSGYSGKDTYFMPDEQILRRYIELGGRDFTIGSDAHAPQNMDCGLDAGISLLKELGVCTLNYYEKRKKISYDIKKERETLK